MHRHISLQNLSLSFPKKGCFEGFSARIYPGSHVAIIGRNGSGKSSLLNILRQKLPPSGGEIIIPDGICTSYVEQTIGDFNDLSGSQRLHKRLSEALARSPDLLLLDEPTNHLDKDNRKSLIKMLKRYRGTLIVVSHDTELLRHCIDTLWHIDNNKIHEFTGSYDDYMRKIQQKRAVIEKELASLKRDKKDTHNALMKEQKKAKKRKAYGEKKYGRDKLALRAAQGQGQITCNKNDKFINDKKRRYSHSFQGFISQKLSYPNFH